MKIAFVGKGGSGKTTVSSLVARIAPEVFREVYVVDSDINMHMKGALGLGDDQVNAFLPIFHYYERHIRARRPELSGLDSLPRTLPPWSAADFCSLGFDNVPFDRLARASDKTLVLELGGYSEKTMGWSCHHGTLGKLQLVLAHTQDSPDQLVIADFTAGADVFGVGMLGLFDSVFVVVEPTLKSTGIFNQLNELAKIDEIELVPIANKIIDASDGEFIREHIGRPPRYSVSMANFVRRLERGEKVDDGDIEPDNRKAIMALLTDSRQKQPNERKRFQAMKKAHARAAKNWPKDKFGDIDLLTLINPDYESLL